MGFAAPRVQQPVAYMPQQQIPPKQGYPQQGYPQQQGQALPILSQQGQVLSIPPHLLLPGHQALSGPLVQRSSGPGPMPVAQIPRGGLVLAHGSTAQGGVGAGVVLPGNAQLMVQQPGAQVVQQPGGQAVQQPLGPQGGIVSVGGAQFVGGTAGQQQPQLYVFRPQ